MSAPWKWGIYVLVFALSTPVIASGQARPPCPKGLFVPTGPNLNCVCATGFVKTSVTQNNRRLAECRRPAAQMAPGAAAKPVARTTQLVDPSTRRGIGYVDPATRNLVFPDRKIVVQRSKIVRVTKEEHVRRMQQAGLGGGFSKPQTKIPYDPSQAGSGFDDSKPLPDQSGSHGISGGKDPNPPPKWQAPYPSEHGGGFGGGGGGGGCVGSCWSMSEGGASCTGCCTPAGGDACSCWEYCTDYASE